MRYIFVALFLVSTIFAETKTEQLSSSNSVKKSERDAIITISRLGMGSYLYDMPVQFCPSEKEGEKLECYSIGNWRGGFSQKEIDSIFSDKVETLVSKKYDSVNFHNRKVKISTATKDLEFLVDENIEFKFQTGSKSSFEREVNNYLNGISNTVQKSLNLASETRYREINEKDQISFIRTKGKSKGIPVEVAQKLLDSAYAFALYYGKIKGSIIITEKVGDLPLIGKIKYYSTSVNISDSFKLIISEFRDGKFQTYKTISKSGGSDIVGTAFSLVIGDKSSTTISKPTQADSKEMIQEALISVMKETMVNLSTKIKRDRKFKVIAPILEVDGNSLVIDIGCQQDIRTDHPFKVERLVDGEIEDLGFFKIRDRGNNCLNLPKEDRENSTASAIKGSYEIYDLALEHPWTGVFISFQGGIEKTYFEFDEINIGGGNNIFASISIKGDLGYIFDTSFLSEVWFDLSFGGGLMEDMNLIDSNVEITATSSALVDFEIFKRLYLGSSGIYTDFGVGAGYRKYIYNYLDSKEVIDTTLTLENEVVDPFAKFGWNFSPDVEMFGKVGYIFPFGTKSKLDDDNDGKYLSIFEKGELSAKGGVNFSIGISIHTDFIGGITKIFSSPPSNSCR